MYVLVEKTIFLVLNVPQLSVKSWQGPIFIKVHPAISVRLCLLKPAELILVSLNVQISVESKTINKTERQTQNNYKGNRRRLSLKLSQNKKKIAVSRKIEVEITIIKKHRIEVKNHDSVGVSVVGHADANASLFPYLKNAQSL